MMLALSNSYTRVLIRLWIKQGRSTFVGDFWLINLCQVKSFPSGMSQVTHHVIKEIIQARGSTWVNFSEEGLASPRANSLEWISTGFLYLP